MGKETEEMNSTIIRDLDSKTKAVLGIRKVPVSVQTQDTLRSIQNQIALKTLWKEQKFQMYADLGIDVYSHQEERPSLAKQMNDQRMLLKVPVVEDKYKRFVPLAYANDVESILARSFEYDHTVLTKLYKESGMQDQDPICEKDTLSTGASEESNEPPVPVSTVPTSDTGGHKALSFGMGILKFLTTDNIRSAFSPTKTDAKQAEMVQTQTPQRTVSCNTEQDMWRREIFDRLEAGVSVHELSNSIARRIRSGKDIPPEQRGMLWRKLLGNQCKINRKLFTSLVSRLDRVTINTRESIYKDIERTYSEFKPSETYQQIKKDVFLVLELFDVDMS